MAEDITRRLGRLMIAINKIVERANEDGIITPEEARIIETARNGVEEYEEFVRKALEDGIIDSDEKNRLIALEENLLSSTYFTAIEDQKIDGDELILLKTLIKTMDPHASVSWLEEDME